MMSNEHISSRFDSELDEIRASVVQMAVLVEAQTRGAIDALLTGDASRLDFIIRNDHQVNMMEVKIDEISVQVVARRQPTARDLRLLMAVSKTVTDLESIGNEAKKIARIGKLLSMNSTLEVPRFYEIVESVEIAMTMLSKSMQAFTDFDIALAVEAIRFDDRVEERFKTVMRHLVACMIENPHTISRSLAMLDIVKAVERMGDHAHNINDYVIYIVRGVDVRHMPPEQVERELFQ